MFLLTERLTFDQAGLEVLTEDTKNGEKNLYMQGTFIQGGIKNHNNRIYPVNEIQSVVDTITEQLSKGESVLGEADHPDELKINLSRVSHVLTKMWMNGNNGAGKLRILPTPMGNIIKTLLECGVKLGVSSRGSGSIGQDGKVSDFEIVTVDIVARPSAPDAYPVAVYETMNGRRRGRTIEDLATAVKHDSNAQKYLVKELSDWIQSLKAK